VILDEDERDVIHEHLPYELYMLENSLKTWNDCVRRGERGFERGLAFENFWLHARNLIDFFSKPEGGSDVVASTFIKDKHLDFSLSGCALQDLRDRINEQICHLQRRRGIIAKELTGTDAEHIFSRIRNAKEEFEHNLTCEARGLWNSPKSLEIKFDHEFYASACSFSWSSESSSPVLD